MTQIMKNIFKKLISLLGPAAVATLGFTGCEIIPMRVEYGTPHGDFNVDIKVTDANGNGIKGIKVIPAEQDGTETLVTDDSGNAQRSYQLFGYPKKYKVYFEDPDGEENGGSFARDSSEFTTTQTRKSDKNWYWGEWTAKGTKTLKNL